MRKSIFRGTMKTVFVLLSIILLSSHVIAVAAQSIQVYAVPLKFTFDETELAPPADQQGFIYNDSTYLPLRFVVHSLNQAVDWDAATSTVTIREPESREQVEIDTYNIANMPVESEEASTLNEKLKLVAASIHIYKRKVTYIMNGETFVPDGGLEGFIVNDRLFVPLRFVSSSLGYDVGWDPTTYSVALQSPAFIAQKLELSMDTQEELPIQIPPLGGGASSTPPTESSIISQANIQIASLESSCQNALLSLYLNFVAETDPTAKQLLKNQGQARLAQCDIEFDTIMTSLQSSLSMYGYSTSIITEYRNSYAEQKALAEAFLN